MRIFWGNTFRDLSAVQSYHLPRASFWVVLDAVRNRQIKKERLNPINTA
jgi:hypothetical protein